MPYQQGTMLQMLGQANENAGAPLPLDRIRARRMQREAAELEEFKADTQRINVNENVASGKETRRQNANLEKYKALIDSEMNKLPVITVPKSDPAYLSQYMARNDAARNSILPEVQALAVEGDKQLDKIQNAIPVDENTAFGAYKQSQINKNNRPTAPLVQIGSDGNKLSTFGQNDKPTMRAIWKANENAVNQLSKAQSAFDAFQKAPKSGGFTGAIADKVGGILGQIPVAGQTMEQAVNLALTGGTAEENTRARTAAITLASDLLPEITGEESGRFTENERQMAFDALKQLNVASSPKEIAEAFKVFIEVSINSVDRWRVNGGEPPVYDTSTDNGALDYTNNLIMRGFTKQDALDALKRRIRSRELAGG